MKSSSLIENHNVPLVLLGGTLCNHRLWQPVIEQLNISCVSSYMVSGADSAPALSEKLLSILPPRFCLVGFSLGAIAALQMLADAPQRLAGLALLSVNPFSDLPANAISRRREVRLAAERGISRWLNEELWAKYVAPQHQDNPTLHKTIMTMAEECGLQAFARQTEVAISRVDHRSALATFPAPVLILNGALDPICTSEHHQAAAQALPQARWLTQADSGHFLPLEAPAWVADALRNWMKEID